MKPLNLLNTILTLFLLCLFSRQVISNPTYFDRNCLIDVGNYTMNSTYQKLRTTSASPSPTSQPNHQLEPSTTSRRVIKACTKYIALLYCIGDMSSQECHGANDLLKMPELEGSHYLVWRVHVVLCKRIHTLLRGRASVGDDSTGKVPVSVNRLRRLYCLVQCSADILGSPCETCLEAAIRDMLIQCWAGYTWTMIYQHCCQLRYDLTPLFDVETLSNSQPTPISSPFP
ncbi:hypothetical protein Cgig2_020523 [Carnegiea gigantea]|uniref:Gnk2-homologous domain-containing protein n=1 Tax=Carnegiea gigantea TaxID=171969 RepID=A0A9Q1KBR6_9CARY|nr:hypothetical protein Cgig2_020523 [Carnegiea gigantea]